MNKSDASSDQANVARIETLLQQASQLPAAEQDIFLTRECGNDVSLRQAVYERLLAESRGVKVKLEGRTGPVTSAVRQALAGSAHDRQVELLGKVVGDYRLVAIVGIGGAGTVYLGERADRAYSAQVAIKVVANTQLSHEIQRRFFAERQILANLNHPYIGRLLDAGETFFDEPFLVMEYVHGEPIDRFCDNQRLNVEERIQLFLKICEAVQYAHRNLIVHRDLKPGNILVSKEGIPKLLDFGIAKLLDESAQAILHDGSVAHTRVHDRLLTPEYASPEQIRGQPVTTTSDVYALGIVLYELLTGTRPYAVNALSQLELERSICIQDPLKPSQMIASLAKHVTHPHPTLGDINLIPSARKSSFKKLKQTLEGDLDAILMKALRKEPEKRYSSVEHLMDDLHRHLDQEPVEARQGNRWYYTQRFIKRHTLGVIAGSTALLALIAVAIILSIQAHQLKEQRDIAKQERDKATQENERAETVSNFMLDVFTAADPFQSQDKQVTAKDLLDKAANKIESTLNDQPEVKARLLEAIGDAYLNQGQSSPAIRYLNQALQAQREQSTNKAQNSEFIPTLNSLGRAYADQDDFENAKRVLKEALDYYNNKEFVSPGRLQTLINNGSLEAKMNHLATAQNYYEQALDVAQQLYGNNHIDTASVLMSLAQVMTWQSDYPGAESIISQAINIYHQKLPTLDPDRLLADLSLGEVLYHLKRFDEATTLINQVLTKQKIVFGNSSSQLVNTYYILSNIYASTSSAGAAEQAARKGLEIANATLGEANIMTAEMHSALANVLIKQKRYNEAELEASLSLKKLQSELPPDHQYIASAEYLLATSLLGQHRNKEAELLLQDNIARWTRANAPAWRAARSESLLGISLLKLGKTIDAGTTLNHASQILSAKDSGADGEAANMAEKFYEQYQHCLKERRINNCQINE